MGCVSMCGVRKGAWGVGGGLQWTTRSSLILGLPLLGHASVHMTQWMVSARSYCRCTSVRSGVADCFATP